MNQNRWFSVKELELKFKSKDDIYRRLTVDCKNLSIMTLINIVQYFLQSKRMCPLGFIYGIINGKKLVCVWK